MRWLLILVLACAGCATPGNPNGIGPWAHGAAFGPARFVEVGMTAAQVHKSYGTCGDKRTWSDGTACWYYGDGTTVWFRHGVVTEWSVAR